MVNASVCGTEYGGSILLSRPKYAGSNPVSHPMEIKEAMWWGPKLFGATLKYQCPRCYYWVNMNERHYHKCKPRGMVTLGIKL
jgi:hypothetical protein